ncbi:GTP pyrophosphokinase [Stella humosa]|uniref:GTP pyrophosphokinase rsh n=1 Tax=Stella humosa TaxID=94 RepID=A0A3N1KS68_9PROT|nr:bifunctional (p)ppGpp synthetase/guanosine-3',5'-bis(diphosphate) 3'-pyrophosphohydrolase [Stella humosa]ROP81240.1 GTP pyrophosphokinase [Stella humosa]BBK32588.1 GTP pyrophosphokinase [Stella humosa]
MMRQFELVEHVKAYDPGADEGSINRAYVFAVQAHGSQQRASGDPYFSHPVEVAGILASMKLDTASIVTGLLHDTVEDTVATLEQIEALFGRDIARLVDGVTKLSRLELQSDQTKQAENFRKLVLAMSEDIRVLLVKLSDRLHNMRTLHFIKSADKRRRIARETMEIYAPLAERIGMHEMKDELEDLAFAELHPDARQSITQRLSFLRDQGGGLVGRVTSELQKLLGESGMAADVSGREKSPYSVWRKMQRKNVGFEQLADIMAFRVVVGSVEDCYHALGVIHSRYPVVPGRFKDYLSTPKPNGYRSLHTGVIGPERQRIEVQIRTTDMHEVNELGVAAHWSYKQGSGSTEGPQYRWLRELLDIMEHASNPVEFLEHTKLEMFQDQVFCFTPKGDLIAMPRGATPVDFAYAVHSAVGDHCVGAKINGRIMPLRTVLQNGDQVDIITSRAQTPSPVWERFVVTGKARARIRRFVRTQQRDQYVEMGRSLLQRAFKAEGHDFQERPVEAVLRVFNLTTLEDLYAAVGEGLHTGREVVNAVHPQPVEPRDKVVPLRRVKPKAVRGEGGIPIRGLIPGMAVHYAGCCHPLPGDRIVGIVTTGKGVTIHTIDCETLESFAETPERWVDVGWDGTGEAANHVGRIHVILLNEPGSMGNLTTIIGKNQGNISNLKITSRSTDFFEILIDIEVQDVKHLTNIIAALRSNSSVNSVERARA